MSTEPTHGFTLVENPREFSPEFRVDTHVMVLCRSIAGTDAPVAMSMTKASWESFKRACAGKADSVQGEIERTLSGFRTPERPAAATFDVEKNRREAAERYAAAQIERVAVRIENSIKPGQPKKQIHGQLSVVSKLANVTPLKKVASISRSDIESFTAKKRIKKRADRAASRRHKREQDGK